MPSAETFSNPPVAALLRRLLLAGMSVVDPFARNARWGTVTNDLNPRTTADYHLDCNVFLDLMGCHGRKLDAGVLDPPYSARQVKECYEGFGKTVIQADTQMGWMRECKDKLDRVITPGGIVISCGWSIGQMGINRGYNIEEILLVAHGGGRHDTIISVERKVGSAPCTTGEFDTLSMPCPQPISNDDEESM
ncbi:MAG: hypothetical protein ABSC06_06735 [Rhodopila sp.]|jgi:hypothetical protein